ncbi:cytochrome P450 4F1-like [Lineus longissimus]|uniref:cytochrome P450 4F1-like n=1 Tax=Lineus longissimus TaxID=88925 RepID=UPI00315D1A14
MAFQGRFLASFLPVIVAGIIAYWLKQTNKQKMDYLRIPFWLSIAAATYCLYRLLKWYFLYIRRLTTMTSDLNNPPKHWLFGNLIDHPGVCEEQLHWLSGFAGKYGNMFRLFHGLEPQLYLAHPVVAKELLRTSEPKPLGIPGYAALMPWLGMGLLLQGGTQWLRNRRLLTPAFHFEMLKNYLKVFNSTAKMLVERCAEASNSGDSVNMFEISDPFTLDTLLRCAFSYNGDLQRRGCSHPVFRLTAEALDIALKRCFNPVYWPGIVFWLSPLGRRYRAVCKEYNDFSRGIILDRMGEMEEEENNKKLPKQNDFLSILLKAKDEDGKGLKNDEILAEVNTFLFAGHDTTTSALCWTLYQLALEPEHQEQCRMEINEILRHRDTDDVMWNDLTKLKYVTMCIKESMRMHTTVPIISRFASKDLEVEGHVIPKDMLINILLFRLHMHPGVWGDPEVYRPDRFLPDEVSKRDTYAFVPFSAGPRNCIGQNFALNELRVAVSRIVKNFKIGLDRSRPMKRMPKAVMRTENGLWLTFKSLKEE